jgi:hypothetical protein
VFYVHASFGEMRERLWSSSCLLLLIYSLPSSMQEEDISFCLEVPSFSIPTRCSSHKWQRNRSRSRETKNESAMDMK